MRPSLALMVCVSVLTAACASGPTPAELERRRRAFPFKVLDVPSPCELVVELPHGAELIHLEHVSRAATGTLAADAIARIKELTRDGVDVRFDAECPLYADTRGVPVARVTVPSMDWHETASRRRTLNDELLELGLGLDPLESSSLHGFLADKEFFDADRSAQARRIGVHAAPLETFEEAAVTSSVAAQALAEARAMLEAEGARFDDDRTIAVVDDAAMAKQIVAAGLPHEPGTSVTYAFCPPGSTIYVRDRIPLAYGRPVDRLLRCLLVHELVHAWQLRKGPRLRGEPMTAALMEGHAQYWNQRIAEKRGFLEDWQAIPLASRQYAIGFVFWRSVYAWLEANGVPITLADADVPLLERLHGLLLGAHAPAQETFLDDPLPWLAANVSGFPSPAWRLEVERDEPLSAGGAGLTLKLVNASTRTLFLHLHDWVIAYHLRDDGRRGSSTRLESADGVPVVVVVPPGESRPLPFTAHLSTGATPAPVSLVVKARLVASGAGGRLFFNGVSAVVPPGSSTAAGSGRR